jgi:hypothetical protein
VKAVAETSAVGFWPHQMGLVIGGSFPEDQSALVYTLLLQVEVSGTISSNNAAFRETYRQDLACQSGE